MLNLMVELTRFDKVLSVSFMLVFSVCFILLTGCWLLVAYRIR